MKSSKESLMIDGKEVFIENAKLDIFGLKYYPENPRINAIISALPQPVNQDAIENEIWGMNSVHELFQQIKNNKGLLEPVYVKGNEVVEGNCRLCCYRLLYKKAADNEKGMWREIPVKILPDDLTETELFVFLGTIHVVAKIPWDPFERASYLWRMSHKLGKTTDYVAAKLSMNASEGRRAPIVYEFMIRNEMKDTKKYSYVDELYKSPELLRMLRDDSTFENTVADWITTDVIPDAQSMRKLHHILNDVKIGPKFKSGVLDFKEALEETQDRHPELISTFYKKIKDMYQDLENVEIDKIRQEVESDNRKKATIQYFLKAVRRFERSLGLDKE